MGFGILCRIALEMPDASEIETTTDLPKLVGKKVLCSIIHKEGTQPREDGSLPVFANIEKVLRLVKDNGEVVIPTTSARASIPTVGDDLD
jgi:myosin-crossreactive antigen